jgi:hypothetical protein
MLGISRSRRAESAASNSRKMGKEPRRQASRGRSRKRPALPTASTSRFRARDGDIVIRRPISRFTVDELFRGKSARQWRRIYAAAFDWDQTPAARSSRNDIAQLYSCSRRPHLDRFRSDQRKGTGRPTAGPRGLLGSVFQKHRIGRRVPDYFPRATVSYECCASVRPAYYRRNPDQPHPSIDTTARRIRYAGRKSATRGRSARAWQT